MNRPLLTQMSRLSRLLQARLPALLVALAVLLCFAAACRRPKVPLSPTPPYETLLLLQADFRRYSEGDYYRHEIPKDISGQNVFRATLARLEYFEKTNPGIDADIVNFIRAQARARLGDFAGAIEAFGRVTVDGQSPLAAKAKERIEKLWPLKEATKPLEEVKQLDAYFADLKSKRRKLAELEKQYEGTYDAILARRELEQADVEYALALFRNRFVVEKGSARTLEFAQDMLERHASSRLIYAHHLMIGHFYFELARDLAALRPPDGLRFDSTLFHNLVRAAQKQFLIVSRADGYEEKPEGAAQLQALEAFTRKVRRLER